MTSPTYARSLGLLAWMVLVACESPGSDMPVSVGEAHVAPGAVRLEVTLVDLASGELGRTTDPTRAPSPAEIAAAPTVGRSTGVIGPGESLRFSAPDGRTFVLYLRERPEGRSWYPVWFESFRADGAYEAGPVTGRFLPGEPRIAFLARGDLWIEVRASAPLNFSAETPREAR